MGRFALYAIGFAIAATITTTIVHPPRSTSSMLITVISLVVMAFGLITLSWRRGN